MRKAASESEINYEKKLKVSFVSLLSFMSLKSACREKKKRLLYFGQHPLSDHHRSQIFFDGVLLPSIFVLISLWQMVPKSK